MICASEHKSAAPLTPADASASHWHLQNTQIHVRFLKRKNNLSALNIIYTIASIMTLTKMIIPL